MPPTPDATVVVCTRNRSAMLRDCLSSIATDTSTVNREIVIVDNASVDETQQVVTEFTKISPHPVRCVRETTLGHSVARNRGVAEARGAYILFTDDDTLPQDGWADSSLAPFETNDIAAVGGRILPRWETEPPSWLSGWAAGLVALRDYGESPRDLDALNPPIGANMAVRRALLLDRPFDARLGHRGAMFMGHDEYHLFRDLAQHYRLRYQPHSVVLHQVPTARMSRAMIRRAAFQNGFGQARYESGSRGIRQRGRALAQLPEFVLRAAVVRRRNARDACASDNSVRHEFSVYLTLGRHLETAFGGHDPVTDWIASHLAW